MTVQNKPLEATQFDGKKARIVGKDHHHHTAEAICVGADRTSVGWGLVFETTDTKERFFVFEPTDLKWL